jgi:hypothetical protein
MRATQKQRTNQLSAEENGAQDDEQPEPSREVRMEHASSVYSLATRRTRAGGSAERTLATSSSMYPTSGCSPSNS